MVDAALSAVFRRGAIFESVSAVELEQLHTQCRDSAAGQDLAGRPLEYVPRVPAFWVGM